MGLVKAFHREFKRTFASGGWTQYRLAKESGVAQSLIAGYLENKVPSLENLERLATAMSVSAFSLLGGPTSPRPHDIDDCLETVVRAAKESKPRHK
jgi:transcriptional regulator with XRE-family HTH domain